MAGDLEKEEKGGGLRREGKGTPAIRTLLFISADAGVGKFLIGRVIMSNLLTCIGKKQP